MRWLNQLGSAALTWSAIGALSGVVALIVLSDQLTFDTELHAAEVRLAQASDQSDRQILEDLLSMFKMMVFQQQHAALTMTREFIAFQIEAKRAEYLAATHEGEQALIAEEWAALDRRLDHIDDRLKDLKLGDFIPRPDDSPPERSAKKRGGPD